MSSFPSFLLLSLTERPDVLTFSLPFLSFAISCLSTALHRAASRGALHNSSRPKITRTRLACFFLASLAYGDFVSLVDILFIESHPCWTRPGGVLIAFVFEKEARGGYPQDSSAFLPSGFYFLSGFPRHTRLSTLPLPTSFELKISLLRPSGGAWQRRVGGCCTTITTTTCPVLSLPFPFRCIEADRCRALLGQMPVRKCNFYESDI